MTKHGNSKITLICLHCGRPFQARKSYVEYNNKHGKQVKFCSRKCFGLHKIKPLPVEIKTWYEGGIEIKEIAELFGVSKAHVQSELHKMGARLNRARQGERNPNYKHGLYIQERIYRTLIEVRSCERCGDKGILVVHHKNGNHDDNRLENLEVLCRSCHFSHHKKEYWQKIHARS